MTPAIPASPFSDIAAQQIGQAFAAGAGNGGPVAISPDGSEIELGESSALVIFMNASTGDINAQVGALGDMVALTLNTCAAG
jgi:hypothetical protein